MHNNSIVRPIAVALLSLTATLTLAWSHPLTDSLPAQGSDSVKTLTGIVTDSKCKGRIDRKAVTLSSCARQCTHWEGADYVLLVGDAVYVLEGHRDDLDKFAGGRATVTGMLNGNKLAVDTVTKVGEQAKAHN